MVRVGRSKYIHQLYGGYRHSLLIQIRYLERKLALAFRTNLTRYIHDLYLYVWLISNHLYIVRALTAETRTSITTNSAWASVPMRQKAGKHKPERPTSKLTPSQLIQIHHDRPCALL